MSAGADWFRRGGELDGVLDDPQKAAQRLLAALPADARAAIVAFAVFGLSGNVTLHFQEGRVAKCEECSHHKIGAA